MGNFRCWVLSLTSQVIGDLAMDPENALCGKKKDAALELKRQGNQCFLKGDYASALVNYSQVSKFHSTLYLS